MKRISADCPGCSNSISFTTFCSDRGELAREKGKTFDATCKSCGRTSTFHVNQFRARQNPWIPLVLGGVAVVITYLILEFFIDYTSEDYLLVSGLCMVPLVIYYLLKNSMRNARDRFNAYEVGDG